MGTSLGGWASVDARVADHTTAVAYDRSGYGGSDPARNPVTSPALSRRPRRPPRAPRTTTASCSSATVGRADRAPDAADRPDLVAGLVLVDPSDEDMELFDSLGRVRQRRSMVRPCRGSGGSGSCAWAQGVHPALPPAIVASISAH